MSILGINSNDYEVHLDDTIDYINLIVSGHSKNNSFEDHQRAIDYIQTKKSEVDAAIRNLPAGIPSGPALRKILWEVLGIWVNVRRDGKLHFQKGHKLSKYYVVYEPGCFVPTGGSTSQDFEIESKDGIIYTHVGISIHYNSTAPHDGYKF